MPPVAPRPQRAFLEPILDHVRAEPSRTWSIIVTIYGDAIVPRGGCVWLGTLLAFFKALDVGEGVVRTAMSRLASDGWLERNKVGRNSFYRLAEKGRATFAQATRHIYAPSAPPFAGHLDLLLLGSNGPDRDAARTALEEAGFGSPTPGLWIAAGQDVPAAARDGLRLQVSGAREELQALAARSWRLDAIGQAYQRFIETFGPMRIALDQDAAMSDIEALVARILLIHEYRRIVLRDPILPVEVLPADWPGTGARALCASLYRDLLASSERWLDTHALDESGGFPPADAAIFWRFQVDP